MEIKREVALGHTHNLSSCNFAVAGQSPFIVSIEAEHVLEFNILALTDSSTCI